MNVSFFENLFVSFVLFVANSSSSDFSNPASGISYIIFEARHQELELTTLTGPRQMLFLIAILSVLAAAALLAIFVKRQITKTLLEEAPVRELPPAGYRPLFEPGEDELREAERKEAERLAEIKRQENLKEHVKKLEKFEELRQTWRAHSSKANTVELLVQASQTGSGEVYWDTCEAILAAWRAGDVGELLSRDLAQLLESHFWLLPDSERAPGVSFRLKEEIAGLRRGSEEGN
jgi:hypothetical protein